MEWIKASDLLPKDGETVLVVKQSKNGTKNIGLGLCIQEHKSKDRWTGEEIVEPYWVVGGCNNVTHWMPLPELPKKEG